jgi:hypothetical protein
MPPSSPRSYGPRHFTVSDWIKALFTPQA